MAGFWKGPVHGYGDFNLDALLALASRLRGGPCTCDTTKTPAIGCHNFVIFLSFEDGTEWAFRAPQERTAGLLKETWVKIIESEAATMKYLRAHSSVPVPEVYSYSGSYENEIGIPYILQSKARGRQLSEYDWTGFAQRIPWYKHFREVLPISQHAREHVMSQLGTLMGTLSTVGFDKAGSLFEDGNGGYKIGECLSPSLVWDGRDELELSRGPFEEEAAYLNALISALISHAKELALFYHSFFAQEPDLSEYSSYESYVTSSRRCFDYISVGRKEDNSKNRLAYCIAGQLLQEMVPQLSTTTKDDLPFTLSHPDLHRGNIFVDENFNITCIIDWSSASTGPVSELLMAHCFSRLTSRREDALANAFKVAFEHQRAGERALLPQWAKSEALWHFSKFVRLSTREDFAHFQRLYELIYDQSTIIENTTTAEHLAHLFHARSKQPANQQLFAELREEDMSVEALREDHEMHFPPHKPETCKQVAVARKLTLMSEMNPYFIADRRLWRWLAEVLPEKWSRADEPIPR